MQSETDRKITVNKSLLLVFGVTLMAVMGVSSIAPAFATIMGDLDISMLEVGYLISFFTIPGVILSPFMGVLADRWGRKKVLIPALMLFGIAGGSCALVSNFKLLLLLRCFQGTGASALGVLAPTILGDLYSGKQRTIVMGYNASVLSTGTTLYPLIGGFLTLFSWRYPFLLPLLAIPLGMGILYFLNNPEPHNVQPIREYVKSTLKTLKSRQVFGIFIIGITTFIVLYGSYLTFYPIILDESFAASSFTIGLIMGLTSITTIITSLQIRFFVRRIDEKILIRAGFFCYGLAMLSIPFIDSIYGFAFPIILYGAGIGINIPCLTSILTSLAPFEHRAAFLSIHSMMLRIGQTIGPVIMGIIAVKWGIHGVFIAGAGFSFCMIFVAAALIR